MNEENNVTNYQPSNDGIVEEKKKSKASIIIIVLLAVCLLCVGGYFAYMKFFSNPFKAVTKALVTTAKENVGKYNKPYKLSGDFTIQSINEPAIFNDLSLKYDLAFDLNAKKILGGIVFSESNKTLFDIDAFIDNNKAYFKLNNLFDKVLYTDYEITEDGNNNKMSEDDAAYIVETFLNAIGDALSEEKLNKESKSITVNGNTIKVTSNNYVINKDNSVRISKRITSILSEDDKLINILAKYTGLQASEIKKDLGASDESAFDGEMKISIYTKGLFNDFAGAAIDYKYEYKPPYIDGYGSSEYYQNNSYSYTVSYKIEYVEDGDNILFVYDSGDAKITADGTRDNLKIKSTADNQEILTGSVVKSADNSYSVSLDYLQSIFIKMNIKEEENVTITPFDVTGAVNVDDLTQEELESISNKLEETLASSDLYKSLMGNDYEYEYEPVEEPWNDSDF